MRLFFIIVLFVQASKALAFLEMRVESGILESAKIAILGFKDVNLNEDISIKRIISADLESSGSFIVEEVDNLQTSGDLTPDFSLYQNRDWVLVLMGYISRNEENNQIQVKYRLWDTTTRRQLTGKFLKAESLDARRIAHIIADGVYLAYTGEKGHFDTKISYVAEKGSYVKKARTLMIADQDGSNKVAISEIDSDAAFTPRFSSDGMNLLYMKRDIEGRAMIVSRDLNTGENRILNSSLKGLASAPHFSPDGSGAIFSISKDGNTNIAYLNFASGKYKMLTKNKNINTSPVFSPDGSKIAFNSDRSGRQNLYIMKKDGGNVKRISFGSGSYATPAWSPDGSKIAFTRIYNGKFYIGVMNSDGGNERLLAKGYMVEGPSWSPNGKMIIFSSQDDLGRSGLRKVSKIKIVNVETGKIRNFLTRDEEGIDPAWSPFYS